MATPVTNKRLNQLLVDLGFEPGETTEKMRVVWRHPDAGTVILLPANKTLELPLPADVVSTRTRLDCTGHLQAADFDHWLQEGKLPTVAHR